MEGTGDQLASLISALFVLRLVTVRFLSASNFAVGRSDHHWQNFEG
jgi:phage-related protein